MQERRVVITGLGIISAIGNHKHEVWQNIMNAQTGIAPMTLPEAASIKFSSVAEVKNYIPTDHFEKKELDILDRFSQFCLIAAKQAVSDAQLVFTPELQQRTAVITGTSIGGQHTHEKIMYDLYRENKNRSNHALGQAFWLIRNGVCDMALTGGSETPLTYGFLKAWEAIRVVAQDTCRPFSKDRQGMILGEGGAMLVLETLESAKRRGVPIYAEITGFGMTSDASHITKPSQTGAEQAIRLALQDAELEPEEIDYINAHGTGTMVNDAMETAAIKNVFGDHANKLSVSATKSLHGHTLGSTSALEAVITVLALQHNILPPTVNYREADPDCDLDIVPNAARPKALRHALSNSFAFGGLNAVIAFSNYN